MNIGPEKWDNWKEHSNNSQGESPSLFKYRDETPEAISPTQEWPTTGSQENPDKAWD